MKLKLNREILVERSVAIGDPQRYLVGNKMRFKTFKASAVVGRLTTTF
jgi:hypothetical protein